VAACIGAGLMWLVLQMQSTYQRRDYSGLKHHAKVHTFRIGTAIVAWVLLIATFVIYPKLIAQMLRVFSHTVENVADAMPEQLGSYVEIGLRELGGMLWFQITAAIIVIRVACSLIAMAWRRLRT